MIRRDAFVALVEFSAHREVIGVFWGIRIFYPLTIFRPLHIETVFGIFAVEQVVSGAVETVSHMGILVGISKQHRREFTLRSRHATPSVETIFGKDLLIFVFRVRAVLEVVLLLSQSHRHETIGAATAVVTKGAVEQRLRLVYIAAVVTFLRIDRVVDALALSHGAYRINDVFAVDEIVAIEAVFELPGNEDHIAIFAECKILRVLAVHARNAVIVHCCKHGHFVLEFLELRKEISREIVGLSVLLLVPCIRPPAFLAVDGKGLIGGVNRDDGLFAEIACARKKIHIVPPRKPSLFAA